MKQRYKKLTHELCVEAVMGCFDGKWRRSDVLEVVEKYAGIRREAIFAELETQGVWLRLEAAEAIAYEMEERIDTMLAGGADDLDLEPVIVKPRPDGMTGKIRDITQCSIMHQLFDHLLFLGLKPLLYARILPQQFASIPGRGQTGLARKAEKYLRSEGLGIAVIRKTDVEHAYGTTKYSEVIRKIREEIPRAVWIVRVLEAVEKVAPGGHLIIGGYIDAWLFNLVMSYALRYVSGLHRMRRDKTMYLITAKMAYMDDSALMGSRTASVRSAVNKMNRWLQRNFGLSLKKDIKEIHLMTTAAEHDMWRRKSKQRPPGLDMGGYVVHRTYTSIRRCIFVRIRRQYIRAERQVKKTGTIMLCRARKLIAYYGYFKRTNTRKVKEALQVEKLTAIARSVVSSHARLEAAKKGQKQYA